MRHVEQTLRAVETLELARKQRARVLMAVDDYVLGHCFRLRLRQRVARSVAPPANGGSAGNGKGPRLDPEVEAALAAGELPSIKASLGRRGAGAFRGVPPDADFGTGLEWLLDGIEAAAVGPGTSAG
jgi:hypothetical protein